MATALVRGIPNSFDRAIVRGSGVEIDVEMARSQHQTYVDQLESAGYRLRLVPPDPAHPDCVFIEDTAVVIGTIAVITRPGAVPRRGEVEPVAEFLAADFELARLVAPATLDGGDVMVLGDTVYVGRSKRTNDYGIDQISSVAGEVGLSCVPIDVREVLHLKSAVLPIDDQTVVVTRGTVDERALGELRIVYEEERERNRFSALPLGNGLVMVAADAPKTGDRLAGLGFQVSPIDVSQIQLADGGLTCMSILYG
ncbi:MAG: N(G),N(G)-dimethylarginine dimethylaminohydrolase [Acidimicrobiia bacterium]